MNEAVMNIIIGVGCSLVASLLFVLFERLVKFGARQNINLIVNYIQDCYWQLEQALYFKDYPIAVAQADNIMQSIIQIYSEIRPLTFLPKKKRLFYTYLYNVFYYMDRVKNVSRGLPLQEEYEWRCEKLLSYLENEDPLAHANWVNNSIELLEHLSKYNGIRLPLMKFCGRGKNVILKDLVKGFCFGDGLTTNQLRLHLMKQEEYYKCIDKYTK